MLRLETRPAAPGAGRRATVRPLGLVLEAGQWLLVHLDGPDDDVLITPMDSLHPVELTSRRFTRPPDFDLADFWAATVRATPPP